MFFFHVYFSQALLANLLLEIVLDFKPGFLVLLSQVFLVQPLFVFNLHVDRIVHQTLILNGRWQFLDLILPVNFLLFLPRNSELVFFSLVVEFAVNYVKIVSFPVFFSGLCPQNFLVSYELVIMVLKVLVSDYVVVFEVLHWLHREFLLLIRLVRLRMINLRQMAHTLASCQVHQSSDLRGCGLKRCCNQLVSLAQV